MVPVSEQTPDFSSQAGLQQHVHIFVILKCAIQSEVKEAETYKSSKEAQLFNPNPTLM